MLSAKIINNSDNSIVNNTDSPYVCLYSLAIGNITEINTVIKVRFCE